MQAVDRIIQQIYYSSTINRNYVIPQIKLGNEPVVLNWWIKSKRLGIIAVDNKNHPLVQNLGSGVEVKERKGLVVILKVEDSQLKEALEKRRRIKLVSIPYWWDLSAQSLKATIDKELSFSMNYKGTSQPIVMKESELKLKKLIKPIAAEEPVSQIVEQPTYLHPVASTANLKEHTGWYRTTRFSSETDLIGGFHVNSKDIGRYGIMES